MFHPETQCTKNIHMLKQRQPDLSQIITESSTNQWKDSSFYGWSQLFWIGYSDFETAWTNFFDFVTKQMKWVKLSEQYPQASLFDDESKEYWWDSVS